MEIQALLTSNILPNDIVCQEIYKHLWRNRNLLNEAQTEAIVQDHFHLKKIIRAYFNCDQYSHVQECGDYQIYFLDVLTSDMLYFLNDFENYTWQGGLTSPSLEKRCPNLTEKNIKLLSYDVPKLICFLWKQMTTSMKVEFYQQTRQFYVLD
jgi:hypothetical protein